MTVVSDVNNSSLQLVEMCRGSGGWSPVCDSNWTLQDATVVCRELDNQGLLNKGLIYGSTLHHYVMKLLLLY